MEWPQAGNERQHNLDHILTNLLFTLPQVEGLTHPWMYFGALFATFCWHTEDHFLYSLNYLHAGASKTWCGLRPHS